MTAADAGPGCNRIVQFHDSAKFMTWRKGPHTRVRRNRAARRFLIALPPIQSLGHPAKKGQEPSAHEKQKPSKIRSRMYSDFTYIILDVTDIRLYVFHCGLDFSHTRLQAIAPATSAISQTFGTSHHVQVIVSHCRPLPNRGCSSTGQSVSWQKIPYGRNWRTKSIPGAGTVVRQFGPNWPVGQPRRSNRG